MNIDAFKSAWILNIREARIRAKLNEFSTSLLAGNGDTDDFVAFRREMIELTECYLLACERVIRETKEQDR